MKNKLLWQSLCNDSDIEYFNIFELCVNICVHLLKPNVSELQATLDIYYGLVEPINVIKLHQRSILSLEKALMLTSFIYFFVVH